MKPTYRRKELLVDRKVQLTLLLPAVQHWVLFLTVGFGLLLLWEFLLNGPSVRLATCLAETWSRYAPAVVVLVALLPVVVYDSLRLSHRMAGPVFHLLRELRRLARGENVRPIKFRRQDFWHDVATEFNGVLARIEALESQRTAREDDPDAVATPVHEPIAP